MSEFTLHPNVIRQREEEARRRHMKEEFEVLLTQQVLPNSSRTAIAETAILGCEFADLSNMSAQAVMARVAACVGNSEPANAYQTARMFLRKAIHFASLLRTCQARGYCTSEEVAEWLSGIGAADMAYVRRPAFAVIRGRRGPLLRDHGDPYLRS